MTIRFLITMLIGLLANGQLRGQTTLAGETFAGAFVTIFVLHALNYAYFFVDDEAIPFVYAQNVLDGHGLVYNPDDGRVEGYSNFLTLWVDAIILTVVRTTGGSKLWVFAIAKVVAFACGIAARSGAIANRSSSMVFWFCDVGGTIFTSSIRPSSRTTLSTDVEPRSSARPTPSATVCGGWSSPRLVRRRRRN